MDEVGYRHGRLYQRLHLWRRDEALNPRHPRIQPHINGFAISNKEAGTFLNHRSCFLNCFPSGGSIFRCIRPKPILFDLVFGSKDSHTEAIPFVATIQASLASRAELILFVFLNPRPLTLLGQQRFSLLLQAINLPSR